LYLQVPVHVLIFAPICRQHISGLIH
jgi:hypothetical protein